MSGSSESGKRAWRSLIAERIFRFLHPDHGTGVTGDQHHPWIGNRVTGFWELWEGSSDEFHGSYSIISVHDPFSPIVVISVDASLRVCKRIWT